MTLREMLLKDFGKDLPISGGFGQSAEDPRVLTSKSAIDAATTQLEPTPMQLALVRGHRWLAILESGKARNLAEVADGKGWTGPT